MSRSDAKVDGYIEAGNVWPWPSRDSVSRVTAIIEGDRGEEPAEIEKVVAAIVWEETREAFRRWALRNTQVDLPNVQLLSEKIDTEAENVMKNFFVGVGDHLCSGWFVDACHRGRLEVARFVRRVKGYVGRGYNRSSKDFLPAWDRGVWMRLVWLDLHNDRYLDITWNEPGQIAFG